MYFPYLRGRQFELIALRELLEKDLINGSVTPIIEPIKLSSTLTKTLSLYIDICSYIKKTYNSGTVFYRARISDKDGLTKSEMGAPPQQLATAGRVNPEGISHLYLGSDKTTTLNEIRQVYMTMYP